MQVINNEKQVYEDGIQKANASVKFIFAKPGTYLVIDAPTPYKTMNVVIKDEKAAAQADGLVSDPLGACPGWLASIRNIR